MPSLTSSKERAAVHKQQTQANRQQGRVGARLRQRWWWGLLGAFNRSGWALLLHIPGEPAPKRGCLCNHDSGAPKASCHAQSSTAH
jgi:hypothetical protein